MPLEQQFATEKGRIINSRLGTTKNKTEASYSLPVVNNAFLLLKTFIQSLLQLFKIRRNIFATSEYKKANLWEFNKKKTKQICPTCQRNVTIQVFFHKHCFFLQRTTVSSKTTASLRIRGIWFCLLLSNMVIQTWPVQE